MQENKSEHISRRHLREKTLQILYAVEMSNDNLDLLFQEILADIPSEPGKSFIKELTLKTLNHIEKSNELIAKHANNWEFERLACIDRILMRMAITEFLFFPDIPIKVTLNEAIEIAKRYSTDQSDKFINGILDSILHELQASNQIVKKGRGLIDSKTKKNQ